jgi:hypothetical protein
VALASTGFANPAPFLLAVVLATRVGHLGVFNRHQVRGLRSHCSSTLYKAHIRTNDRPPDIWCLVTSNTALIPARDCLSMPLNMELSFAHSDVAAVEGAWPVMGFASHQQMHGGPSPGRTAGCSHFSRQHYGGRSAPRRRHTRRR